MSLETIIPFRSKDGNQYLIEFKIFDSGIDFGIPIIDVSLVLVEAKSKNNLISELFYISNIVDSYLRDNDVVLYFYCDNSEIDRSEKNKHILPQQYRSMLFDRLFKKKMKDHLIKRDIVIGDLNTNDIHCISLISTISHERILTKIFHEVNRMNEK